MTVIVVGGSATGVEIAGAIDELTRRTLAVEFRNIDPTKTRFVVMEAGPRLLAAFSDPSSKIARRALERMGVEVRISTTVTVCDDLGIVAGDERIEAGTVIILAAGVRASALGAWLHADHDRAGRIKVTRDLSVSGQPHVFFFGDAAAVTTADSRPVPGVVPAAKQTGRHAGSRIKALTAGRIEHAPFVYKHQGD